MSDSPEHLGRLATLCGIQPDYQDIWGQRHVVEPQTQRALLNAMGIDAGSEEAIESALWEREQWPWRRMFAPVAVVYADQLSPGVHAVIQAAQREHPHPWRIVTEQGAVHEGQFQPHISPVLDHVELDGSVLERHLLPLPQGMALGYHRLELTCPERGTA